MNIYIYVCSILISSILFGSCSQNEELLSGSIPLADNWKVQRADLIEKGGKAISSPNMDTDQWYTASVPTTLMGMLTQNGEHKNIMEGYNMKDIDKTPFRSSWWFRTEFGLQERKTNQHTFLNFEGIIYSADIWLNGELVASRDSVYGTFRQFTFDISQLIKEKNTLAIQVFPPLPGDPNIGFADWNPRPADENMGLFRPVSLTITGDVKLEKPYVQSSVNTKTLDEAWLTIQTNIHNYSDASIKGKLIGKLDGIEFSHPVTLTPGENKLVTLASDIIEALHIQNPRLWWCNNMGDPELYNLELSFVANGAITSTADVTFGIREVETYLSENGHRGFKLNGKDVLLKGAGWTDDIFLRDTYASNEEQVRLVKDMNLNLIRFENFWGNNSSIYELCDKYGLLSLIGWSCHWEWDAYYGKPCDPEYGCIQTDKEIKLIAESFRDQVLWLRNHPSIIAWMPGSDMLQKPELEKKYMEILAEIDNNRPYIGAAKARTSPITGRTGTKMAGPYEYVGPNYWYIDTVCGGAFGFNTETGIGAQLPELESIKRFIPSDKLWPINDGWGYHCTASGSAMNSLSVLTKVMNEKYGKAGDLDDYLLKANLINYDGTRAMFEAFRVNKPNTTGLVQWMLNSAWTSLYWQLYDYYKVPTAGYYAVKKANLPLQLIYNYGDNAIYAVNESMLDLADAKATIEVYSTDSKLLSKNEIDIALLKSNMSEKIFDLPKANKNTIIFLTLNDDSGSKIADNYYALSIKADEYMWDKTTWVSSPMKAYNNYHDLAKMERVDPSHEIEYNIDNDNVIINLKLRNTSSVIAFFTNVKLLDSENGIITPVFWSDNYISIAPNGFIELTCKIDASVFENKKPMQLLISGWNIDKKIISIQ